MSWGRLLPTKLLCCVASVALLFVGAPVAHANNAKSVQVAVATNFLTTAQKISEAFQKETGESVTLVSGSTGKLAAQIMRGAPFDVFLSADAARPALLVERGFAVSGSQFTYAVGKLALWSAKTELQALEHGVKWTDVLRDGRVTSLAIANPALAPYGLAAQETLTGAGLWQSHAFKTVVGENVGQAFAMASTVNADVAIVARSLTLQTDDGRYWPIDSNLHAPIAQDAVLVSRAENNRTAQHFLEFLASERARTLIEPDGYSTGKATNTE